MARTIVTGAQPGEDYADPIVIPISMSIPDPHRAHRTGMTRLRWAVVLPANGWRSSDAMNQEIPGAPNIFTQAFPGKDYPLQNDVTPRPKHFINIQFDGEGKQPLGPKATEALEELRAKAE